ncbi:acylphosphatase [Noviherbaspirillum sp.]|uniref:acylphosphatase n=1 Tax=Noviherbaspirillum sp. TaxID=1926288 RepID=UPI002FE07C61
MSTRVARHLRITGIVQGVSYRASFERRARALGLSGWVRNRLDTSVEALIRGDADAIDTLIGWARRGPPGARVDNVAVSDVDDGDAGDGGFDVRSTV